MDKSMIVKVYDFDQGMQLFENIQIVRLKSKDYTLLIMPDFIPTIGELNGDISVVGEQDSKEWKDVIGYYVVRHNIFELILKDEYKL